MTGMSQEERALMTLWSRVPEGQRRQITSDWFADGCPPAADVHDERIVDADV
jgi:hypothetical protein